MCQVGLMGGFGVELRGGLWYKVGLPKAGLVPVRQENLTSHIYRHVALGALGYLSGVERWGVWRPNPIKFRNLQWLQFQCAS